MWGGFDSKTLKLKRGDICDMVRGKVTVAVCKDETDARILTSIQRPRTESNFCEEDGEVCHRYGLQSTHGMRRQRKQNV